MDVEATEWWQPEHLGRHHEPVRGHHQDIGVPACELRPCRLAPKRRRLREWEPAGKRYELHGARRQAPAASARAVRLRQDADDLVMAPQRLESWQREFRCAREGDAQLQYARRAPAVAVAVRDARSLRSLSSRLRIRSRLRSER